MANRCLDVTQEQMIGWMSEAPFDFEPGERFLYNNSGFWLAGVIIEQLSGHAYPDYVQAKLFEPLGLGGTITNPIPASFPTVPRAIHSTRGSS
jgi:CubicO group peptidase (beta-lactamase class C family)